MQSIWKISFFHENWCCGLWECLIGWSQSDAFVLGSALISHMYFEMFLATPVHSIWLLLPVYAPSKMQDKVRVQAEVEPTVWNVWTGMWEGALWLS